MTDTSFEKYQLAGLDDRQRGFNREVHLDKENNSYRAALSYEKMRVTGEAADTTTSALSGLVQALHAKGYSQLRSRLIFRGVKYLGSQEPWIEYPDPRWLSLRLTRLWDPVRRFLGGFRK